MFNNSLWRKTLNDVCNSVDISPLGLEVISPFGFEVIGDKSFLNQQLRRFYVYLGLPNTVDIDPPKVTFKFKNVLLNYLNSTNVQMANDIVLIIENKNIFKLKSSDYQCKLTDKMLDIQFRHFDCDLLTDYSDYLIASLSGLKHEQGEGRDYKVNKMWRWRLYQLYVIQEKLFGNLLPAMTFDENLMYLSLFKLTSNSIQVFYESDEKFSSCSKQETVAINQLIKPRVNAMYDAVQSSSSAPKKRINCNAYHYDDNLEIILDLDLYEKTISKIKNSYFEFI